MGLNFLKEGREGERGWVYYKDGERFQWRIMNSLSISITNIFKTLMYSVEHISIMSLVTALLAVVLQVTTFNMSDTPPNEHPIHSTTADFSSVNLPPSREHRALSKGAVKFRAGVDPSFIIARLNEKQLLTKEEWNKAKQKMLTDDERLDAVWEALVRRVAVNPSVFHSVVEILNNEPAMEKLGNHMQGLS